MSRLLPEFEKAKEESNFKEQDLSIEQEIECSHCHDVMTLCSDFGRALGTLRGMQPAFESLKV